MQIDLPFDDRVISPLRRETLAAILLEQIGVVNEMHNFYKNDPSADRVEQAENNVMALSCKIFLRRLWAARQRLAQGNYGFCLRCGGEISIPDLRSLALVRNCRHCALLVTQYKAAESPRRLHSGPLFEQTRK